MRPQERNSGTAGRPSPRSCTAAASRAAPGRFIWGRTMARSILSDSRSSTKMRVLRNTRFLTAFLLAAGGARAQGASVPPGKAEAERICIQCHEFARSVAPRQDRAGWQATLDKMVALGAKGTQKD